MSFASGAAALIYEIVWFHQLELAVGSTAVSLGVLLATFMGGTCLGSLLLPGFVSPQRNPLRIYAVVELGIGTLGLLQLGLLPFIGGVYASWSGYGVAGFLLRGLVAAVCLLPPTLFMGATFPALARAVRSPSTLGLLYGANITGAVAGCLVASFYLLRIYDVTTATLAAAAINAAAMLTAGGLSRNWQRGWLSSDAASIEPGAAARDRRAVYVTIALSGFCALAAEAIWTRMLGLLLGASVYTFSIVLAAFLIGLGIGSGLGSFVSLSLDPRRALAWCQLLLALAIGWTGVVLAGWLPYWPVNPSISTSIWFNFQLDFVRALWALLPPAVLWGASFSLALAAANAQDTGRLAGRVYAANTFGAIAGALSASLMLIAWIGSQRAEQLLIVTSALAGLILLRSWKSTAAAIVLTGVSLSAVPRLPGVLIAHGRFAASWVGKGEIVYAGEGMNSPVAVSQFDNGARTFHVAGKIQASSVPRDMRLQRMLGHLTTLVPAHPRSILVIGCGAGVTAGAVSIDPRVERVTIAEIEPLVPRVAAAYFRDQNFGVLENPKVRLRIDDGRHYLLTAREQFDGITIDPLDPWVKGAANLYTKEFFEVMRRHLAPGGVVTMYIQLFETNLEAVQSALATFFEVFPNGTVWGNPYEGKGHDMVLLGQAEPLHIDLDEMEIRYRPLADSLAEVGMYSPVDLFATYAGRARDLKTWLRGAAINLDGNLRMQYLAGFGLNADESAAIYASMLVHGKFPEEAFFSREGRADSLRSAVSRKR